MPREHVQLKLRMPESLRQQIEDVAKERGVSLNTETVRRLADSFEREATATLSNIAEDMKNIWLRYGDLLHRLSRQGDLIRAAEVLTTAVEFLDLGEREDLGFPIREATARVREVIKQIENEAAQAVRLLHTTGGSP